MSSIREGLVLGSYQFLDYKTNTDKHFELESAMVLGCDNKNVHTGASIANAVCLARDLGNHPGNYSTPVSLLLQQKKLLMKVI